ncbi:MAG TPA: hypothetical protein VHW09_26990 [Bryobacteraceae bacterium]|jgi:hypothetical protein|nr:hypothetical protein [Bryobacteraceae bacterium]
MSFKSENHALKRLSSITWKPDNDGFLTMDGYFTPAGARTLLSQLGEEGRDALGLVFIAHHSKAMMRRSQAERIFEIEGLPLNIQERVRAL